MFWVALPALAQVLATSHTLFALVFYLMNWFGLFSAWDCCLLDDGVEVVCSSGLTCKSGCFLNKNYCWNG